MPKEANEGMVEARRTKMFSPLWEELSLERREVEELVKAREEDFIEEYGDNVVPDWLLRIEAQDLIADMMMERLNEEED